MGRYFTDEVIDEVINKWEETYPGAIERAQDVMKHPYRDNDEADSRNVREFILVVRSIPFLAERETQDPNFHHDINSDVFERIGDMLGPITYHIND